MPLYVFACQGCGREFEELAKAGAPDPPCPRCGAASRRRPAVPAQMPRLVKSPGTARRMEASRRAAKEKRGARK